MFRVKPKKMSVQIGCVYLQNAAVPVPVFRFRDSFNWINHFSFRILTLLTHLRYCYLIFSQVTLVVVDVNFFFNYEIFLIHGKQLKLY